MKSMTGFGKCELEREGYLVSVELKTVNNRFLDLNLKLPKVFSFCEDALRKLIAAQISRGRCDVFVTYEDRRDLPRPVRVDEGLAAGYVAAYEQLRARFALPDDFTVSALMRMPDVLRPETREEDAEVLKALLLAAAEGACDSLNAMRETEGENLRRDLSERLAEVETALAAVRERAPLVVANYREKLRARIADYLKEVAPDEARLLNEVAFYADRVSIDEEIARLTSHIAQMKTMLVETQPQGRKLDFLVQEFNREANTICSKSNDQSVTAEALLIKGSIEKIREQVQNVE